MPDARCAFDSAHINSTRLRFGTHDDLPAIGRLIQRANAIDRVPRFDAHELATVTDPSRLLVLQLRNDEVAAAACVAPGRGLVFLVIDPEVASVELEHRMMGVAAALHESEQRTPRRMSRVARGRR